MSEHYTKSTMQVSVWCNPCGKMTMHRVDDGRRGPCLECLKKLDQQAKDRPAKIEPVQLEMFK
jgi:hypothetical protein